MFPFPDETLSRYIVPGEFPQGIEPIKALQLGDEKAKKAIMAVHSSIAILCVSSQKTETIVQFAFDVVLMLIWCLAVCLGGSPLHYVGISNMS